MAAPTPVHGLGEWPGHDKDDPTEYEYWGWRWVAYTWTWRQRTWARLRRRQLPSGHWVLNFPKALMRIVPTPVPLRNRIPRVAR